MVLLCPLRGPQTAGERCVRKVSDHQRGGMNQAHSSGTEHLGSPPQDAALGHPEAASELVGSKAAAVRPAGTSWQRPAGPAWLGRIPGWLVASALYLAASVAIWWHVWTGHPTSTMVCDCGDPSSFAWFLSWPAYAISHGHSLFLATQVHVPAGINLLDNTSVLALGIPLAPVTWLFGPVVSLNVALTAAPALTALSAYGCLHRALRLGWPAASLGGLLFGFSPFVLHHEAVNHLQLSFLAVLPLIFWCGYELVVAQRGRWWRSGMLLGTLIALQFFVGTEMLTIAALATVLVLVLVAVAAWGKHRLGSRGVHSSAPVAAASRAAFAVRGLIVAAGVAALLLAYPLWFALAGPQHIHGAVWRDPSENGLAGVLFPLGLSHYQLQHLPKVGYLGPPGTLASYLGIVALAVLAVALVTVRRPLLKLCAAMTIISMWLSLGSATTPVSSGGEPTWLWLPWGMFAHLPVLDQLAPANFSVVAAWFTVVAGALLVDQLLAAQRANLTSPVTGSLLARPGARLAGAAIVGAALLIPWLLAWPLPYKTGAITVSPWAAHTGNQLPSSAVVLFYPFPSAYLDHALIWQAQSGMRYSLVGGRGIAAGPGGAADHGLTPGTPQGTMSALSTSYPRLKLPPPPTPATIRSFRSALRNWGVTTVVMTAGGRDPGYARSWLTAMLGANPTQQDGAWVWNNVQRLIG